MRKKITAVLCTAVLILSQALPSYCASSSYIKIVGKLVKLSTAVIEQNGTSYYPVGEVFENLGTTVKYELKTVTVSVNGHSAEFTAGSKTAVVDMVTVSADCPFLRNGDVMVEESFFINYAKYMEFPCEKQSVLTFTSLPEITQPEPQETEEEFYSKFETESELIGEEQLFSAAVFGGSKISTATVEISDLPGYDKALCVNTLSEPTAIYDCQIKMFPKGDLPKNRFAVVSYMAKLEESSDESGNCFAGPCYEQNFGNHVKAGSATQEILPGGWEKHFLLLSSGSLDYTADGSQFNMRFGYKPQTVLITGLKVMLLRGGYTLDEVSYNNVSTDTYFGREDGALWRDEAFKRILKYRTKDISVFVSDGEGKPVSGVSVKAQMTKNEFMFGTAVHNNLLQASETENASGKAKKYAQRAQKYFNTLVYDNAGKWPVIEENCAVYATGIYNWAQARGIGVRGHALFWDNPQYYSASFANAWQYMTDDERLFRTDEHINQNLTYFGNKIKQWDLLNEPLANRNLINRIGLLKTAQLFKTAKAVAPEVSLYINETGINGNSANWQQVKKLRNFTEQLKSFGAPVDGIGVQAHCGGALRYPQEFYNQLDYLAQCTDEIAVTEYDFSVSDQALAADNLRDMLIAAYSHPKATGFLTWGFWDGQHWKDNAPFFDINWNEKQALSVWDNYVNNEWKTSASGSTDSGGVYGFRGHKGEYLLTVTYNGTEKTARFDTGKDGVINVIVGNEIEISPDSVPGESAKLAAEDYLKYRTDLKTGNIVPAYQLPEEYDKSIINGKNAGVSDVYVNDSFDGYGTEGKDENGRYINPVTNENIWGQWYGAEASQKRGTVLGSFDGRLCLAFYRQKNPEVIKSVMSTPLQPNCFAADTSESCYSLQTSFMIPYNDGSIGLRSGRYAEFGLGSRAGENETTLFGVYTNTQNPGKPLFKYGNYTVALDENVWYDLAVTFVPDGMGGLTAAAVISSDNGTITAEKQRIVPEDDLRFMNITVNSFAEQTYTRSVFYLDSIKFSKTDAPPHIVLDGQTVKFNGELGQTAYAAAYDKTDGRLLEVAVKKTDAEGMAEITLKTNVNEADIKAFLWNDELLPFAEAKRKE